MSPHIKPGGDSHSPGMAELVQASISRTPDRVAVGVAGGGMRLSYRQLGQQAHNLARQLEGALPSAAGPIALYCDNCPEFVVGLLAAWITGATVVPVDPQLTAPEIRARLAAVGARGVLVPQHLRESYPANAGAIPVWGLGIGADGADVAMTGIGPRSGAGPAGPSPAAHPAAAPAHPGHALLLFTAGSTGTAKIVPLSHANLAASVAGVRSTYELAPDDATLLVMPLFHGHGLIGGLLATLATGGAAYLPASGRFSAHAFWDEIAQAEATWYTAVPTIHQILLARAATNYPASNPPVLRFIRSCSATLAPAVLHQMEEEFGAPVIPAYGMTETAHQAASNPLPRDGACKDASVGLPTGLQMRIMTSNGQSAGTDQAGEVCVCGPALADGYLNDPGATAAAFTDGWFHTGDLGYLDSAGYLFLTGRIKDMINRGGEKIAPHAVETVLLSDPAVQDALAFPVPDPEYGEEINAAVILRPGQHATEAGLQQYCRGQLTAFEIPKKIYFLDRFPRTVKGDTDRRALAAAFTHPPSAS
jgi:oxalate---CoA ligase